MPKKGRRETTERDRLFHSSAETGEKLARKLIERSERAAFAGPPAGYLIAEGDSWFDYPVYEDILEALEQDHHYRIRSAAHHGDTVESMAYDESQLDKLRRVFQELAEENDDGSKTPKAILLSCGGNDVVQSFGMLLNHRLSGLPQVNDDIVKGLLQERVPAAIVSLITSVTTFSTRYFGRKIPVVIHGYGNPVPDGRPFPILQLSGPWLKPGFTEKGYVTADPQAEAELQANADTMSELIKEFNDVLKKLPAYGAFTGIVKYVDLRSVFSNRVAGGAYLKDWRDEMHARKDAFRRAADLIAAAI